MCLAQRRIRLDNQKQAIDQLFEVFNIYVVVFSAPSINVIVVFYVAVKNITHIAQPRTKGPLYLIFLLKYGKLPCKLAANLKDLVGQSATRTHGKKLHLN